MEGGLDHCNDGASPSSEIERRTLPNVPWVSLAEALTWIAFGDAMKADDLRAQVEGDRPPIADGAEKRLRKFFSNENESLPQVHGTGYFEHRQPGLVSLTEAWSQLRNEVDRGTVKVRGRFTPKYSLAGARLADVEDLTGAKLATFSQFDVSTGGIRRKPDGSPEVIWQYDPQSFDREVSSLADDAREADGYLLIEVDRSGLIGAFLAKEGAAASVPCQPKKKKGRTKGTGYQRADAPLLKKMREAISYNSALNATSAAKLFADEAEGASFDAKVDRLARAFRAGNNGE